MLKPILYGNTAKHFGAKRDSDGHTHQWKVYIQSLNNDDLSVFISRIQFRLHETYADHVRSRERQIDDVKSNNGRFSDTSGTI